MAKSSQIVSEKELSIVNLQFNVANRSLSIIKYQLFCLHNSTVVARNDSTDSQLSTLNS